MIIDCVVLRTIATVGLARENDTLSFKLNEVLFYSRYRHPGDLFYPFGICVVHPHTSIVAMAVVTLRNVHIEGKLLKYRRLRCPKSGGYAFV